MMTTVWTTVKGLPVWLHQETVLTGAGVGPKKPVQLASLMAQLIRAGTGLKVWFGGKMAASQARSRRLLLI